MPFVSVVTGKIGPSLTESLAMALTFLLAQLRHDRLQRLARIAYRRALAGTISLETCASDLVKEATPRANPDTMAEDVTTVVRFAALWIDR